jgi:E3 ubiquitin-protein ligase SHPRH
MVPSNSDIAIRQFKGTVEQGKQSIRQRRDQRVEPNVLLLLFRHGANGLNLLEAHHVILIEPLLNPAAEAQAINRVHRIGQQNATFVHRFIVGVEFSSPCHSLPCLSSLFLHNYLFVPSYDNIF